MSSQITFDNSKFKIRSRALLGAPEVPGVVKFLVKNKIVKTENKAMLIIIIIFVLSISTTIFFVNKSLKVEPAIPSPSLNLN